MRIAKVILFLLCSVGVVNAQHVFKAKVIDYATFEPLPGVIGSIKNQVRAVSDEKGFITITSIPEGAFEIELNLNEYGTKKITYAFPLDNPDYTFTIEMDLLAGSKKIRPVTASTTRNDRPVTDLPTRIEVIKNDDLDGKSHLSNGDLRYMLSGNTGLRLQQTSFTSVSTGIRTQGLNGRYTQILRDGFPIYSGFSGRLSVLQISPLDLKQVEIVKGSSSTLYGEGGVSGLVNLISRTPEDKKLSVMLQGSSALGLDVSAFYSQKFKKIGTTLFAARNGNWTYDPAGNGFSAVPEYERYTFNPGLYFYLSDKTQLNLSLNSMFENRTGGDTKYLKGEGDTTHSYFEKNVTDRISSQLALRHRINEKSQITSKNSIGFFKRRIEMSDYRFSGMQLATFTEVAYNYRSTKLEWVVGVNGQTDKFTEDKNAGVTPRDYKHYTVGLFAQNIWNVVRWFSLETGMRGDYHNEYGFFALPRFSALFKMSSKVSARVGGGMGYRTPTLFTDEAETIQYRDVLPINTNNVDAEKSIGTNADVTYKTKVFGNQGTFSLNQLVFYTRINNPAELTKTDNSELEYEYVEQNGFYDTKGTETNISLTYKEFSFGVGYTFADVKQRFNGTVSEVPFSARHRFNGVFSYEIRKSLKVGFEAAYTGKQRLSNTSESRSFWICNVAIEKMWKHFSVFVNCENMLNVRQTKFEKIYSGTVTDPAFNDLYAPVDGVVAHLGIKVRL